MLAATFPATDPIPLPAPVWLFKALSDVTLTLHFLALQLLLGGILLAAYFNARGHRAQRAEMIASGNAIGGWLPVIMTYVINLGIPPLLFAQVLYGRALYTSSVLIGAWWIAVIPLLIGCYHPLYIAKARAAEGKAWWPYALFSLLCAWAIAKIYTINMTLMLQPESWREMYRNDPSGSHLVAADSTWLPRLLTMILSGFIGVGVLAGWLSRSRTLEASAQRHLGTCAPILVLLGSLGTLIGGYATWAMQPEAIRDACSSASVFWIVSVLIWAAGTGCLLVQSGRLLTHKNGPSLHAKPLIVLSLAGFVQTLGAVLCRDGLRDASLARAGFDVWDRSVVVNWSVLLLFLGLFVVGLGVVGWLASVAMRASVPAKGDEA